MSQESRDRFFTAHPRLRRYSYRALLVTTASAAIPFSLAGGAREFFNAVHDEIEDVIGMVRNEWNRF